MRIEFKFAEKMGRFLLPVRGQRAHIAVDDDDVPLCNSTADIWARTTVYDPDYPVCRRCAQIYRQYGYDLPEEIVAGGRGNRQ